MESLQIGKGLRMPQTARDAMNREGIRQGVTRSMIFATAVLFATLIRLFLAMIRASYDLLGMFKVDPYTLMWGGYAVLLILCIAILWQVRRMDGSGNFALIFSLCTQTLCLLVGITMAMAGTDGVNVLPYTTAMILFTLISTYPLGITIPILTAAHCVFALVTLIAQGGEETGAMLVDQTSVLALAVASLVIVYMSRRNAHLNAQLTRELSERNDELFTLNRNLRMLMLVDEMTGLANRRGFDRDVELSWQHCKRQDLSMAVCLLDIDQFRRINDRFGRHVGDECLVAVAQRLTRVLKRSVDVVARLGGEEFALLLPFTNDEGAMVVGERIRTAVEGFSSEYPTLDESGEPNGPEETVQLTTSIGIALSNPAHDRMPVSELMRRAEYALRVAKQLGGNRIIPWKDPYEAAADVDASAEG